MKFEDYLKIVAPIIGPSSAFSLARDSRIQALEDLIVSKQLATKEELEELQEAQLEKLSEDIQKMPKLPKN